MCWKLPGWFGYRISHGKTVTLVAHIGLKLGFPRLVCQSLMKFVYNKKISHYHSLTLILTLHNDTQWSHAFLKIWVALKRAGCWFSCGVETLFRHVLHGYGEPAGCPLAWWSHAWRGWRKGWCPRRDRPSKPRWPPGEPWRRNSGISGQSWSPGRFHVLTSGMVVSWWGAQCSSGTFWFHGELLYPACICGAS